ncbi:MAG: hypothetical protein HYY24_19310 [Verrucomicrobia bacterium]|nr:hypothetical protein [Verrucomicrobiota bacterium]
MDDPWYRAVHGSDLEQGDILENCPVYRPRTDPAIAEPDTVVFDEDLHDVIVVTQSCDLALGREKVSEILLCPVWRRSELNAPHHLSTSRGMEEARRGAVPGFHVLAASSEPGLQGEVRVVDFRRVYTLPVAFVRRQAEQSSPRLRLLPPYREHLSQAFARYFMRVGLPVDIPPFR